MLRYRLPTLAAFVLFSLIVFVTRAAALLPTPPLPDPFAPFSRIQPGTSVEALDTYGCETIMYYGTSDDPKTYCRIRPGDGPVFTVGITEEKARITNLWFHLRGVQMAHLVARWGWPTRIYHIGAFYRMWWGENTYAVVYDISWLTQQSSVLYVSMS
jgi:hypothetical protein